MRRATRSGLVLLVVAAAGCFDMADDCTQTRSCPQPAPRECAGTCLPKGGLYWTDPYLVWLGGGDVPMACPAQASAMSYIGKAVPPAPVCNCECEPSEGSCSTPTMITTSTTACPGTAPGSAFDLAASWDGSCTVPGVSASGVESVTVAPLVISGESCKPVVPPSTKDPPASPTAVLACFGRAPRGTCEKSGDLCEPGLPRQQAGDGWEWTYCVAPAVPPVTPPTSCPPGYPRLFNFVATYDDTRGCAACTCDAPIGSSCSSLVTLYSDPACSDADDVGSVVAVSSTPKCVDVSQGSPFIRVTASVPQYTPGMCSAGGGAPTGSLSVDTPVTYCCL